MRRLRQCTAIALFSVVLGTLTLAPSAGAQSFEGMGPAHGTKVSRKRPATKAEMRAWAQRQKEKQKLKQQQRKVGQSTIVVEQPPPSEAPAKAPGRQLKTAPPAAAEVAPAAAPATQAAIDAAPKTAPVMSFDAVDVAGKSGDRQRIEAVVAKFNKEEYESAGLAADEIMKDPSAAALHLEAQYLLAKTLYRMGMYHSALGELSKILAKGPQSRFFKNGLEWLFFISHKTVNETVILEEIAKYSNFEFPEKFRNEFRYLLARYHFVRGRALDQVDRRAEAEKSFNEVKRLALTVPRTDPFFPRAKYLEGLAYFRDGNFTSALEAMKEVVRLTKVDWRAKGAEAAQKRNLRELAFMQLARTHYGHRQNRNAIHYYGKVERGNPQWLEALFESSWANYRIGQYEQALGNLITLSSPFFREEYFPEALILKAVIYYENCRYRESTMILEDFERIYMPVHNQLEAITRKDMEASEYYNVLSEIQKKNKDSLSNTDLILERVLRLALTDKDLKGTNDSILELETELDRLGMKSDTFKYSELTKGLLEGLKVQRGELVRKAGIMAKGKLEFELAELKKLLANGERIKFETSTKEKEFLELQLTAEGRAEIVKKYKYSVAVADDQLYWPFEGEYWRDELGTYQYTLTKGCVDRDRANVRKAGSDL